MRRLAIFFTLLAAVLGAAAATNWWVDPFGEFWDAGLVARAAAAGCLVSNDLVGPGSWLPFKEEVIRERRAREIVIGTSRVLKLAARGADDRFANAGTPGTGPQHLERLLRRLHDDAPGPVTLYVGVELFWFNRSWDANAGALDAGPLDRLEYLLGRDNLEQSVRLLRGAPGAAAHRWERADVAGRCVLDRAGRVTAGATDAWRPDGSFVYRFELVPSARPVPDDDYTRDLVRFGGPYYRDWPGLDARRLEQLSEALAAAKEYGWRVIGFAPPYSSRYVERLSTAPQTAAQWRAFGPVVRRIFERHGFAFVDLRVGRDVPCADDEYVDDGWHPDDACAARVRARISAGTAA